MHQEKPRVWQGSASTTHRGYRRLPPVPGPASFNPSWATVLPYNVLSTLRNTDKPLHLPLLQRAHSALDISANVVPGFGVLLSSALSIHSRQVSSSDFLLLVYFPPIRLGTPSRLSGLSPEPKTFSNCSMIICWMDDGTYSRNKCMN